jgi:hypothetical protein
VLSDAPERELINRIGKAMNDQTPINTGGGCPVHKDAARSLLGRTNKDWWPEALPVDILHQGGVSPDPMGPDFDYVKAFKSIDYQALKADLTALMTDSKPGGRPIMAIMVLSSSVWPGTLQAPIAPLMAAVVPIVVSSALLR